MTEDSPQNIRSRRILAKYKEEQRHIQYLLSKGWHPLEIADQMTEHMIELLRTAIEKQHPDWDEQTILQEMRKKLKEQSNLQKRRGLRQRDQA